MKRILSALFVAMALASAFAAEASGNGDDALYRSFVDPPRDYSPMPFWFWNGKMEGTKIAEEIDRMAGQHVYGAFLHARDGLQTPYLSDAWWNAISAGLKESKRAGFEFNFVDEYDWPSGEARNIWGEGSQQSEVLASHPEFHMKSLAYKSDVIEGPGPVDIALNAGTEAVIAAQRTT